MTPFRSFRSTPKTAAVALLSCASALASAVAGHIDFIQDDSNPGNGITDANFSLTSSGPLVTGTQMGDPADVLGGTRVVSLARDGGFGGSVTAAKTAGSDAITFRSSNNLPTGTLTLDYPDITNSDFITLWDAFEIDVPLLENRFPAGDGEIEIVVSVESSAGSGSVRSARLENPGLFAFTFDDPGFAGVDFGDVEGVSVAFESKIIGTNFDVASITRRDRAVAQVPDSGSSAALLSLSLVGLVVGRSLKKGRC